MSTIEIVLSAANMGPDATEDDFDRWAAESIPPMTLGEFVMAALQAAGLLMTLPDERAPIPHAAEPVIAAARGVLTVRRDAVLSIVRAAIVSRATTPGGHAYEVHAVAFLSSLEAFVTATMPEDISRGQVHGIASAAHLACSAVHACVADVADAMEEVAS